MEKILIVDDDKEVKDLIQIYLENEGYNIIKASDGIEALNMLKKHHVDLIILDIMMPNLDGISTCIDIRKEKHMPIIIISSKSEDFDKIYGLSSGADDYLTKPFNLMELVARVKSQIRRNKKYSKIEHSKKEIIEIGNLTINRNSRQVYLGKEEIKLTTKEFDILNFLAENRGTVMSVSKIFEFVWKEPFLMSDNNVMVHITKIREKLHDNSKAPIYIKTIWGAGYKI
jgi:DNA-binding response OmpR family regulator